MPLSKMIIKDPDVTHGWFVHGVTGPFTTLQRQMTTDKSYTTILNFVSKNRSRLEPVSLCYGREIEENVADEYCIKSIALNVLFYIWSDRWL